MKISDILSSNDIVIINDTMSKKQLLQKMTTKLAQGTGIDERTMLDIITERENLGSTAFGGGTALPHGRVPGLTNLKGIFAKLGTGIDFEAADKRPVDLLFMLVSPENSGADHLSALAQISKVIKNDDVCTKIREAQTCSEIYRILTAS